MTTAVITGGFGYAGGRIARHLLEAGTDVRISTRRREQDIPKWARDNVRWDADLEKLSDGADCLIHLAAPNEIACAADPEAAIAATVGLTERALGAARAAGIPRFIYMSTVHVYGPMQGLIDENTAPDPGHPYAVAHLQSEHAVQAAAENIDAVVLRLSNGFGAPADNGTDRWSLLVNDLCRQAIRDHRLQLSSNGLQHRDFLPLSDVAAAVRHFVEGAPCPHGFRMFNLSSGRAMRVIDMAALIRARAEAMLGVDVCLETADGGPPPPATKLVVDNRRLLESGFQPNANAAAEIDGMLRFCIDTCMHPA
ncbi:MAG: SDR family oxidoreductase [Rhodospirillales bacterium]|nr:SDR family oxidoreductase [Rhodospirillales bacterium]